MKRLAIPGLRATVTIVFAMLAASCGGGGGGGTVDSAPVPAPVPTTLSSTQLANVCTLEGTKLFTHAYMDEAYLWYREIPVVDPATYTGIGSYFYALLTKAKDAFGQPKDRFSFIVTSTDADSITTGLYFSYGVRWETDGQGRQRAAFVEAGSPAQLAGLARGGELVKVLTPGTPDWYPNTAAQISFTYRPAPDQPTRDITMSAAAVQEDPLPLVNNVISPAGKQVAYMLFNAHTQGAQDKLIAAVNGLRQGQGGVRELVLDMRYNGGGFLYTAASLAAMVASPAADGKVFEQLQYNDKRQDETNESVIRFSGQVQVGETQFAAGTSLPRLGLPRVYLLTSGGTCSASESVVNSLRGVGVDVVLVGDTTCGKPYGFTRKDNCGASYFPIEFQGVNDKGFGDYPAGFAPTCPAADDFDHALGDTSERLLATALHHVDSGSCAQASALQPRALRMQPAVQNTSRLRFPGKLVLPAR